MDQRGEPVVSLSELDDLRDLVRCPGWFLSVHLPLGPANEESRQATALRWRACREQAEGLGAPTALLDAAGAAIDEASREAAGLGVVAVEGRPPHVEHLSEPPVDLARWRDVPALVPLIATRQADQPHVVALVDRQGADLAVRGDGAPADGAITVDGSAYHLRKVAPGGWSQRRFQQRAEEGWHRNMVEVVEDLVPLAERHDARVVAIGGDERAVGLLVENLPTKIRGIVRPIEVTRAADGSATQLDDAVDRVVHDWTEQHLAETIAAYESELGQHDRATAGLHDTLAALRDSRVATLVVAAPAGPDADAAVAAALATGADVQVVDRGRMPGEEAFGAILRW